MTQHWHTIPPPLTAGILELFHRPAVIRAGSSNATYHEVLSHLHAAAVTSGPSPRPAAFAAACTRRATCLADTPKTDSFSSSSSSASRRPEGRLPPPSDVEDVSLAFGVGLGPPDLHEPGSVVAQVCVGSRPGGGPKLRQRGMYIAGTSDWLSRSDQGEDSYCGPFALAGFKEVGDGGFGLV